MDVAFIFRGRPGGEGSGSTQTAMRIASELAARGHGVTVYGTREPLAPANVPERVDVRVLSVPESAASYNVRLNRAIRARRDEFDEFDITHSYQMEAIPALGEIAATGDTGTVVTLQAYGGICPKNDLRLANHTQCTGPGALKCAGCAMLTTPHQGKLRAWLGETVERGRHAVEDARLIREGFDHLDQIDALHTYTDRIKRTYCEFGYPSDRITVVPNILDERFLVPHTSSFTEPYRLLFAGRLSAEKGVRRLVPILAELRARGGYAYELTIAGDGPMKGALDRQLRRAGLEEDVAVLGHVPYRDLPALYASHDIFLYPGIWEEPFGRVFLEALATGTPVAATDVGSVNEIVGEAGIVRGTSTARLIDTVEEIAGSARLERMSARGKARVGDYRPATITPKIERMYRRVLRADGVDDEVLSAATRP